MRQLGLGGHQNTELLSDMAATGKSTALPAVFLHSSFSYGQLRAESFGFSILLKAIRARLLVWFIALFVGVVPCSAFAGDFSFNWGGTHNWTASSLGPNTFTLTDPYGFQVDIRLSVSRFGGTSVGPYPDDLLTAAGNQFGSETSIWLVWDSNSGSSGVGESTNTATMEILNGGVPFNAGSLSFRIADIDAVDNNNAADRCDFITATGNAGNPVLSYVGATPSLRSVFIGPGAGSGSTGLINSNQAQCIYNTGATTSPSSNGDDNGSVLATYPAGTHTATVAYDESIENVYGVTSRDASARGAGVWGATLLSVNQTISLAKSTTSTSYSASGQTITYTYVVTNNGPLPIRTGQNIQIQDDKIGTFNCPAIVTAIPTGGTHSCTANYTVTAADMSASNITNNAIAGVGTGTQSFATRLQSNTAQVVLPRSTRLTLTKISNGGTGGFTFTGNNGWASQTITTTAAGGAGTVGTTQTLTAAGVATTLTEGAVAGYTMTGVTCTGTGGGTQPTVNLASRTIAFTAAQTAAGSNIACTITNTKRPTVKVQKTTTGGFGGPFAFAQTNLASAPANITTAAAGTATPASPTAINVTTIGTAVTLTETPATGYALTGATCTDANSAVTGNSGSIGSLSGNVLTIPAGNVVAGADFTCVFTNTKLPTITLTKISNGGTGGFTFTGNNGWASQTITTTAAGGAGTAGATQTLTAASTATTITETIPSGWMMTAVTCTGTGGGTQPTVNLSTGAIAFTSAQTAAGSNIACTVTNELRNPSLIIVKSFSLTKAPGNSGASAEVGDTIVYTYVVTNNGNQTISNVDIDDSSHTGLGSFADPFHNGAGLGLTTDAAPTGDSPDGNADNTIWGTLAPNDVLTFRSSYVVTQADVDAQ